MTLDFAALTQTFLHDASIHVARLSTLVAELRGDRNTSDLVHGELFRIVRCLARDASLIAPLATIEHLADAMEALLRVTPPADVGEHRVALLAATRILGDIVAREGVISPEVTREANAVAATIRGRLRGDASA